MGKHQLLWCKPTGVVVWVTGTTSKKRDLKANRLWSRIQPTREVPPFSAKLGVGAKVTWKHQGSGLHRWVGRCATRSEGRQCDQGLSS